jgi:hypothetical protein
LAQDRALAASDVVAKVRLRWSVIDQIQGRGVIRFCFGRSHQAPETIRADTRKVNR